MMARCDDVTDVRSSKEVTTAPLVEVIPSDRAWNRVGRDYRPRLSLRAIEQEGILALRRGTGASESAINRRVFQTGLAVLSRVNWTEVGRLLGVASDHGEEEAATRVMAELKAVFGEL